jgi:hypothetical protein
MKYRIKEKVVNGQTFYYPQYKKLLFWRRFVWWGGEDGTFPHTVFYSEMSKALWEIEKYKEKLKKQALVGPNKTVYHYIDDQEIFNPNSQPENK